MKKLRPLIGLPVLEIGGGAQVGEVREVVLNLAEVIFAGVVVTSADWFNEERGILFPDLFGIGRDAVTIRSSDAVTDFSALAAAPEMHKLQELCDKQIYTEKGEYLGVVTDVLCDFRTGEITGYELSDGFITDFLAGRRIMPLPRAQVTGEDRLVVPDAAGKLLPADNNDPGGVV